MSSKTYHFDTSVLDRLKKSLNLKNDRNLADYLEVLPSVIANWRSRRRINITRVLSKCEHLDIHWILFGTRHPALRKHPSFTYGDNVKPPGEGAENRVTDDPEELIIEIKSLKLENLKLKSKIEVLEELIITLKTRSSQ